MSLSKFSGVYRAWDYAFGINPVVPALQVLSGASAGGTYSVTLAYGVVFGADGNRILPAVGVPIGIGSGAGYEVVTPTAVSNPTPNVYGTCTITAVFSNGHGMGEQIVSADGGINEAAAVALAAGGGLVALDFKVFNALGLTTSAGLTTYFGTGAIKSLGAVVTLLNWSGLSGALSYRAAAASNYASTTVTLY